MATPYTAMLSKSLPCAALMLAALSPATGHAQAYPARPVMLIVPYAPGGGADITARVIARYLAQEWGQPVIVESKSGGGTTIGAAYVARAQPDGYTLLVSVTQHAIAPSLFRQLPYDYLTSLTAVALLTDSPFILTVRADSSIKSVPDLLAALKAKGSAMNFGSSGPASVPHLAGEMLNQAAGSHASHIPFPGTSPAFTALLGGQIDFLFGDTSILPSIQAGKARALAVTTRSRAAVLPDVPAMSEFIPGFALSSWVALEAPAGTPRPIIDTINASVQKVLKSPELSRTLLEAAKQPLFGTPEEFAAFKSSEVAKFHKLTRSVGVQLE